MKDNKCSALLGPIDPATGVKKQNELGIKHKAKIRARLRQQRYLNKIKKRQHKREYLNLLRCLKAPNPTIDAKPEHKPNIHSLFYVKPTQGAIHGHLIKIPLK